MEIYGGMNEYVVKKRKAVKFIPGELVMRDGVYSVEALEPVYAKTTRTANATIVKKLKDEKYGPEANIVIISREVVNEIYKMPLEQFFELAEVEIVSIDADDDEEGED